MADSDGALDFECARHLHQVAPESAPAVRRLGLAAAAVTARVDRQAAPIGKHADDLVPAPRVEAGGVREQQRWIFAGPLPHRQLDGTGTQDSQFRRRSHLSETELSSHYTQDDAGPAV